MDLLLGNDGFDGFIIIRHSYLWLLNVGKKNGEKIPWYSVNNRSIKLYSYAVELKSVQNSSGPIQHPALYGISEI